MTVTLPDVEVRAVCHDCRKQHTYRVQSRDLATAMGEWTTKHQGHNLAFGMPKPVYEGRWSKWLREFWGDCPLWAPDRTLAYGHNADVKGSYVASAAYTFAIEGLATSSTRTAGYESTGVSNAANKYLDYFIGGKVTTGTTPTANKQIDIWAGMAVNDTPLYPDVLDGTTGAETITSENVRNGALIPLKSLLVDNTSDRTYWMAPVSLASAQGSFMPMVAHVLFAAHDTAVNLNPTGSNHAFYYTGAYGTVA